MFGSSKSAPCFAPGTAKMTMPIGRARVDNNCVQKGRAKSGTGATAIRLRCSEPYIGALLIRIGLWGTLCYNESKNPPSAPPPKKKKNG